MTEMLFRMDPYRREAEARVTGVTEQGGIVLNRSLFYPTGGGQPGDGGALVWSGGRCDIDTCVKGDAGAIICVPRAGAEMPAPGEDVVMTLDWDKRYGHMRIHTALHLLSVVIPNGVTGGSIGIEKGRLDFDMADPPDDKEEITARLNALIESDAIVSEEWITEAELDANPNLVKTLSVQPPKGAGHIRLVRISKAADTIDLQPCGGTHVRSLSEIGTVRLGKVEKKGRMNRRVYLHLVV